MQFQCAVDFKNGCASYNVRTLYNDTYSASLLNYNGTIDGAVPNFMTIKKVGSDWKSYPHHEPLAKELGEAIDCSIQNELYEHWY